MKKELEVETMCLPTLVDSGGTQEFVILANMGRGGLGKHLRNLDVSKLKQINVRSL